MIHPGDLLHGDRNGVTTIPVEIAAAVADGCRDFVAAEAVILDYLKSGRATVEGYASAHKECRRLITELTKRLKASRALT